jgi:hemerythrin
MARSLCPAYKKNKEGHALFLSNLRFYRGQYENTSEPKDMLGQLHESLVWWMNEHILKVDMQMKGLAKTD